MNNFLIKKYKSMGSLHTLSGGLCRFRRFRKGANGSSTAGCGGITNGS